MISHRLLLINFIITALLQIGGALINGDGKLGGFLTAGTHKVPQASFAMPFSTIQKVTDD